MRENDREDIEMGMISRENNMCVRTQIRTLSRNGVNDDSKKDVGYTVDMLETHIID